MDRTHRGQETGSVERTGGRNRHCSGLWLGRPSRYLERFLELDVVVVAEKGWYSSSFVEDRTLDRQ